MIYEKGSDFRYCSKCEVGTGIHRDRGLHPEFTPACSAPETERIPGAGYP